MDRRLVRRSLQLSCQPGLPWSINAGTGLRDSCTEDSTLESTMIDIDVLICGGGPTGLLLGYILARKGVKATIIGMHTTLKIICVV